MNHLSPVRLARILPRRQLIKPTRLPYSTADRTSDRIATNDPSPVTPAPNVSKTNALPTSPQGMRDSEKTLQETPDVGEAQRVMQAPNREKPWSRSQQPRERAMSGPRFEQTIMEFQVRRSFFGNCDNLMRETPVA